MRARTIYIYSWNRKPRNPNVKPATYKQMQTSNRQALCPESVQRKFHCDMPIETNKKCPKLPSTHPFVLIDRRSTFPISDMIPQQTRWWLLISSKQHYDCSYLRTLFPGPERVIIKHDPIVHFGHQKHQNRCFFTNCISRSSWEHIPCESWNRRSISHECCV